jgi:hypothetical protein
MPELARFPYFEVQFTKKDAVHGQQEAVKLTEFLTQEPVTDLLVMAHGWNNDMNNARSLYRRFFMSMREVLDSGIVPNVQARRSRYWVRSGLPRSSLTRRSSPAERQVDLLPIALSFGWLITRGLLSQLLTFFQNEGVSCIVIKGHQKQYIKCGDSPQPIWHEAEEVIHDVSAGLIAFCVEASIP